MWDGRRWSLSLPAPFCHPRHPFLRHLDAPVFANKGRGCLELTPYASLFALISGKAVMVGNI